MNTTLLKPAKWTHAYASLTAEGQAQWANCVLAWPLWDKTITSAPDLSGNALSGVFGTGLVAGDWLDAPFGPALKIAPTSGDKITVADPATNLLDGWSAFSVSMVFRLTSVPAAGVKMALAGKYRPADGARSWRLYLSGSEIEMQVSSDGVGNEVQITQGAGLVAGQWYHLIVTWSSGAWQVWLDGVLQTVDAAFSTTSIFGGNEEFKVGQRTTSGGGSDVPLDGQIADVRVWSAALSSSMVARVVARPWVMYEQSPGEWIPAGRIPAGTQLVTIPGLTNGVAYSVRLRTADLNGNEQATGVTISGTPAAPSGGTGPLGVPIRGALQYPQTQRNPW